MLLVVLVVVSLFSAGNCRVITRSTDSVLKAMQIEMDKNCVAEKIGLKVYENMKYDFADCVYGIMSMLIPSMMGGAPLYPIANSFCWEKSVKLCHDIALTKLDVCLTDIQRTHLKIIQSAEHAAEDYACQDIGKVLKDLENVNTAECLSPNREPSIPMCKEKVFPELTVYKFFEEKGCKAIDRVLTCQAEMFKPCDSEPLYHYISKMGQEMLDATPCKKYRD